MKVPFYKFHGNGNDFILVDNLKGEIKLTNAEIKDLCHRRFGIGADGLLEICPSKQHAFLMNYYNSDGNTGTMCGNGGRCAAAYAHFKAISNKSFSFEASDGLHQAIIDKIEHPGYLWQVSLSLQDVNQLTQNGDFFVLNTGSPHVVKFVDDLNNIDVLKEGNKIRNSQEFLPDGVNVNFVKKTDQGLFVRTYERGVEDETLSCGTGVTAAGIAAGHVFGKSQWNITAPGGHFNVSFKQEANLFSNIWLHGPATLVGSGEVTIATRMHQTNSRF